MSEDEEILTTQKHMARLEKKAKAYDDYLKQVDTGEILVLTPEEALQMAGMLGDEAACFLENHTNWRRPGYE